MKSIINCNLPGRVSALNLTDMATSPLNLSAIDFSGRDSFFPFYIFYICIQSILIYATAKEKPNYSQHITEISIL